MNLFQPIFGAKNDVKSAITVCVGSGCRRWYGPWQLGFSRKLAERPREIHMAPETRRARYDSAGTSNLGSRVGYGKQGVFRKEGEYWTVGYCGNAFPLKDTRGLGYLAHLLRHPAVEFHVLDLFGGIASQREEDVQFLFHYERAEASAVDTIQAPRASHLAADANALSRLLLPAGRFSMAC